MLAIMSLSYSFISLGEITLKDFKNLLDRGGSHRYYFKSMDPDFGSVREEVSYLFRSLLYKTVLLSSGTNASNDNTPGVSASDFNASGTYPSDFNASGTNASGINTSGTNASGANAYGTFAFSANFSASRAFGANASVTNCVTFAQVTKRRKDTKAVGAVYKIAS